MIDHYVQMHMIGAILRLIINRSSEIWRYGLYGTQRLIDSIRCPITHDQRAMDSG